MPSDNAGMTSGSGAAGEISRALEGFGLPVATEYRGGRIHLEGEVDSPENRQAILDVAHGIADPLGIPLVEEGIVPGGGVALLTAAAALDGLTAEGDIKTGVAILRRALEEPMRGIAENAGYDGAVVVEHVRRTNAEAGTSTTGFDVIAEDYVDLIKAGIIDPAKVTRSAVENAASIGAMILTTEALITDKPEKNGGMAMPPGGMGGMDY